MQYDNDNESWRFVKLRNYLTGQEAQGYINDSGC